MVIAPAGKAMVIQRLRRFVETVRWLRPVQVWGRLWFRWHRPRVRTAPAPALRSRQGPWLGCARPASLLGPRQFRFLGVTRTIALGADWNHADASTLWLYNAHYFDDLVADAAADRAAWHADLIAHWLAHNPPGQGIAWEPYPTSLRLVNWAKCAMSGRELGGQAMHSLAIQARWLRGRLEHHLLGNHLLANAKALVFCGVFFDGSEASRWLSHGLKLLRRELAEQVLPDGGHFERSPMYHAVILEDVLDLCRLAKCYPGVFEQGDVDHWRALARRMLRWLRVMSHPDGDIAFFNDAAIGIAPTLANLSDYARALDIARDERPLAAIEALPDSGFVRLAAGPAVLFADVGSIGPDYLPGHAHAGTLSFELSLHGQRLVVNSGTSTYALGRERDRQRGTAAHSTVEAGGRDSSEVWAGFRVARRARVSGLAWREEDGALVLEAAHDGYQRQGLCGLHHRRWRLDAAGLAIRDRLDGDATGIARLHLHPAARPRVRDGKAWVDAATSIRIEAAPPVRLGVRDSSWHPGFGASIASNVIEAAFEGECQVHIGWSGVEPPSHD